MLFGYDNLVSGVGDLTLKHRGGIGYGNLILAIGDFEVESP